MAKKTTRQRYLLYEDAIPFIRKYQQKFKITNREQYWRWFEEFQPPLPKYPNRVYDEWVSWNEWFGNDNCWGKTQTIEKGKLSYWREFWEAVAFAQQAAIDNDIKTRHQWFDWVKQGNAPKDIPQHPEFAYKDTFKHNGSWDLWLGRNTTARLQKERNKTGVVGLFVDNQISSNIIKVLVFKDGFKQAEQSIKQNSNGTCIRLYVIEQGTLNTLHNLCTHYGSEQEHMMFLFSNVNQLLFECDSQFAFAASPRELACLI